MKILFIGKGDDVYSEHAAQFIQTHFSNSTILFAHRGEDLSTETENWNGDIIISYLSPWILPASLLEQAQGLALNFHPGPPAYPGIGCTNFALYDEVSTFGVTCHHMLPAVDTGEIVAVRHFPVFDSDTVLSLTYRCYGYLIQLFYEVVSTIVAGDQLPRSEETWLRKPFTRRELNELCRLTADMSSSEKLRRIRAVTFPNAPGAYIEVDGKKIPVTPEHVRG